jgi:hypothetical protein
MELALFTILQGKNMLEAGKMESSMEKVRDMCLKLSMKSGKMVQNAECYFADPL